MMEKSFRDLKAKIINTGLCVRCGICIGVCPVDVISKDSDCYPCLNGTCIDCGICYKVCPGGEVDFKKLHKEVFNKKYKIENITGYVESVSLCNAKESRVRNAGSSGGVVTMLLLYLLEKGHIDGAIVVTTDDHNPLISRGVLARTKEEILKAAKSKYIVTPSMEILKQIRSLDGKFAIVGLPCQVHGIRKLANVYPELFQKIYIILGLICHYTLEPDSIKSLAHIKKINEDEIEKFEFRGGEWPGNFRFTMKDGSNKNLANLSIPFTMNWMFAFFSPYRCYRCFDGINEFADLSFGDFLADAFGKNFVGKRQQTMVFQKSVKGRSVLDNAVREGYVERYIITGSELSNRTIHMIREKKNKSLVLLKVDKNKGKYTPDYGIEIAQISKTINRIRAKNLIISFLRKRKIRNVLLNIIFSKLGRLIDKLNYWRKKNFTSYLKNKNLPFTDQKDN